MQRVLLARMFARRRLQMKHGGYNLQTIVDAVVDLFEQHLLAIEGLTKLPLDAVALNCHPEDIRRALEENNPNSALSPSAARRAV